MLYENPRIIASLERTARKLVKNIEWQEDLVQEARLHLWWLESKPPGQAQAWYLIACSHHMRHCLQRGHSIDSYKRHYAQALPPEHGQASDSPDWSAWEEQNFGADNGSASRVSADDIRELLLKNLPRL